MKSFSFMEPKMVSTNQLNLEGIRIWNKVLLKKHSWSQKTHTLIVALNVCNIIPLMYLCPHLHDTNI